MPCEARRIKSESFCSSACPFDAIFQLPWLFPAEAWAKAKKFKKAHGHNAERPQAYIINRHVH
jgi:hypothetical protein